MTELVETALARPEGMSDWEAWVYYKQIERRAKEKQKELSDSTKEYVHGQGDAVSCGGGSLHYVSTTRKKAKDSLKLYLHDKNLLEMCQRDDIDLSKVNQLIEAGALNENEVNEHTELNESSHLRFKPNRLITIKLELVIIVSYNDNRN